MGPQTHVSDEWMASRLQQLIRHEALSRGKQTARALSNQVSETIREEFGLTPDDDDVGAASDELMHHLCKRVFGRLAFDHAYLRKWAKLAVSRVSEHNGIKRELPRFQPERPLAEGKVSELNEIFSRHLHLPKVSHYTSKLYRNAVADFINSCIQNGVIALAQEAIANIEQLPSRLGLGRTEFTEELSRVVQDPSFMDQSGTVPFRRALRSDQLSLKRPEPNDIQDGILLELKRAVTRIRDRNLHVRLSNVDDLIADLVEDYHAKLIAIDVDPLNAYSLLNIGLEIDRRLGYAQKSFPDAIDASASISFETMLSAHYVFIGNIDWISRAVEKSVGASKSFEQATGESRPDRYIKSLSETSFFDARAREFLKDLSTKHDLRNNKVLRRNLQAVVVGGLRGALVSITKVFVESMNQILDHASEEYIVDEIFKAYEKDQLLESISNWVAKDEQRLRTLAASAPQFYEYILPMISIVKRARPTSQSKIPDR